jgi:Tfp pilus assembly protein PilV
MRKKSYVAGTSFIEILFSLLILSCVVFGVTEAAIQSVQRTSEALFLSQKWIFSNEASEKK